MQILCTLLQTDNHNSTSPLKFTGQMLFLMLKQQCKHIEGNILKENTHTRILDYQKDKLKT